MCLARTRNQGYMYGTRDHVTTYTQVHITCVHIASVMSHQRGGALVWINKGKSQGLIGLDLGSRGLVGLGLTRRLTIDRAYPLVSPYAYVKYV